MGRTAQRLEPQARISRQARGSSLSHAGVAITYDRYGHLMPGNEAEAVGLLDAYLDRAVSC